MKSLPLGKTIIINPSIEPDTPEPDTPEPAKVVRKKITGIGDVVHKIAQPIAKSIDMVAGTKIQQCGGCKKRREALNKAFPIT
jgi:hypothetical protein